MGAMTDEIIRPDKEPRPGKQSTGLFGSFLAASGATLLAITKLGAAMTATVWAVSKLFGFPDVVLYVLLAAGALPVAWAVVWTAGRAWHVERRLEDGLDVDTPVFDALHYWKRG
jgi:hypothetical protein